MSNPELIQAVKTGDHANALSLIEGGVDVNQQGEQGWTPLNFAAGKGDLAMVRTLVEGGADIFKLGHDRRTPYMIALAAGRVSVAKYLAEVESRYEGEIPVPTARQYCRAYHLGELRRYEGWSEGRGNKLSSGGRSDNEEGKVPLSGDRVVFLHQDFTVTESMWHDERVIFSAVDPAWKEYCVGTLEFRIPDDLDLIVPNEPQTH